ncbi:helix-turn-helix transcriptional regulator [Streptomyces sp. WELS2]|uniref:helix-turn-helix domain-containing protein n=1 Tax=Streptomyces sp. WELS2 TaxID=2749435 RepID=UPI002867CFA3|nr:helix-turn-helix transcriptional regulator [Streptomyces sp. WELS2]
MSEEAEVQELDDEPQPDSVVPLIFGRLLKRLRTQAGVARAELGRVTGYSVATIASFEQGRRIPNAKFIMQADEVLDAKGALTDFVEEMESARYPAFFQNAAALEKKAVTLYFFAVQAVPGLLQTGVPLRHTAGDEDARPALVRVRAGPVGRPQVQPLPGDRRSRAGGHAIG